MPATDIPEDWLPDEAAIAHYQAHGWYVSPSVFDESLLDAVRNAIDAHHAGRRDHRLDSDARFSDWQPGDGEGVRNNEFCSLQNDGVAALVRQPVIGAIAARLATADRIRLFDDQAIYKPSAGTDSDVHNAVGWHTDHSYWSTCTSTSMLTAWIPLHDASEDNGTLYVVDGSHRWPESEHVRGFNDPDLDGLAARLGRPIPSSSLIPMRLKKGQMSFHHMRSLHASSGNSSGAPRYAVAVHMQDGGNRYQPYRSGDDRLVSLPHDHLCRQTPDGLPDYTDPAVFPILWPATARSAA